MAESSALKSTVTIGIDLGTTNSVVAVYQDGQVSILENEDGHKTTPSYVHFGEGKPVVGDAAKEYAALLPMTTIYDAKRILGRRSDDDEVLTAIKNWPFVVENRNGKLKYVIAKEDGTTEEYFPEEISALVLRKMCKLAKLKLGCDVTKAVVTVPAYYNNDQRTAVLAAAKLANLSVDHLIHEPTAAALAFGVEKMTGDVGQKRMICVYDLGGGTFDVTICEIEDGVAAVRGSNGIAHLGGQDFDQRLLKYLLGKLKEKYNVDLFEDKALLAPFLDICEKAKRDLSRLPSKQVMFLNVLPAGHKEKHFVCKITREEFEELIQDLLERTISCIEEALKQIKLDKNAIEQVLLVGGSSRIPKIKEMLSSYFDGKRINSSIDADHAVAMGAAIYAAKQAGESSIKSKRIALVDVTPLSLGVKISGGEFSRIVPKNSTIPTVQTRTYYTTSDNQDAVKVMIYEGERVKVAKNHLLGTFILSGLPRGKAGTVAIDVSIEVDLNAILKVKGSVKGAAIEHQLTVEHDREKYTKEEIAQMVKSAALFQKQEQAEVALSRERENFKCYLETTLRTAEQFTQYRAHLNRADIILYCQKALDWLKENIDCSINQVKAKRLKFDAKNGAQISLMMKAHENLKASSAQKPCSEVKWKADGVGRREQKTRDGDGDKDEKKEDDEDNDSTDDGVGYEEQKTNDGDVNKDEKKEDDEGDDATDEEFNFQYTTAREVFEEDEEESDGEFKKDETTVKETTDEEDEDDEVIEIVIPPKKKKTN